MASFGLVNLLFLHCPRDNRAKRATPTANSTTQWQPVSINTNSDNATTAATVLSSTLQILR